MCVCVCVGGESCIMTLPAADVGRALTPLQKSFAFLGYQLHDP